MSKEALQVRNPDTSAMHGGIKKWLITNSVFRKVEQNLNVDLWKQEFLFLDFLSIVNIY